MATCDLEKQQLRQTTENTPPIIYHIPNNNLSTHKTHATATTKTGYTKHIRCQPIWFSILFLTFLALTMILATASISTNRILDVGNIPFQKLRKISQEFTLSHHPSEDAENEQGEDLFARSLFRSNIVGKHLLDMVKRPSSNSSGVPNDLSSIKPLPSTVDPTLGTSTSLSATSSSSITSNPTSDAKSSSSSAATSSGHATSSKSSATTTGHASTTHSSATATGHSKTSSSSSSKDNGGAPTDPTSGYLSAPTSASPTSSGGNGNLPEIPSASSTQSESTKPTSSASDSNDGNSADNTNKPSSSASDVSPTNSAGDGTPNSNESPAPKKSGHKGNAENHDNSGNAGSTPNDAISSPVKSPVTRKTYFTTTLADGAVSTRTSTTILMAEAQPTSASGSDKFKGPNGLQTSKAFQKPVFSFGPVLGMTGIIIVAFM